MLLVLPMPLTGGSYYPFHSVVAYAPLRRISILRKSDGIPDRNLLKSPAGVIFRVSCGVFPLQGIASGGRGLFGKPAFPLMGGKFFLGVEVAAASVAAKLVCLGGGRIRIGSECAVHRFRARADSKSGS